MRASGYQVIQTRAANGYCVGLLWREVKLTQGLINMGPMMVAGALAHEYEHRRLYHNLQYFLMYLYVTFIGIVPVWHKAKYYDLRRLRLRHEFEADAAVIRCKLQAPLIQLLDNSVGRNSPSNRARLLRLKRSLK